MLVLSGRRLDQAPQTVAYEILEEARSLAKGYEGFETDYAAHQSGSGTHCATVNEMC